MMLHCQECDVAGKKRARSCRFLKNGNGKNRIILMPLLAAFLSKDRGIF